MSLPVTYSVAEVAEAIGRSPYWLAAEARAKRIPHSRIGREVRFTDEQVTALLATYEVRPAAPLAAPVGMTPRSAAARRLRRPA